jgi:integrase
MVKVANLTVTWEEFAAYLLIERKQAGGKNLQTIKSRFHKLELWFNGKEFNRQNFNSFIYSLTESKFKNSYINCFIKLGKHIDRYFKLNELADYTYFKENREKTNEPLTPREIRRLAEVRIKYTRDRDLLNQRYKTLIYFLGVVGSRITETLLLTKECLTSGPTPMVNFPAETTKSFKDRSCPIPKWLYQMLMELPDADTLFGIKDRSNVSDDLKKRAIACKIEKRVHPHLFRDSSINNQLDDDIPLEEVTQFHGHASTAVTFKYYTRIKLKKIADNLNNNYSFYKEEQTVEEIAERSKRAIEKIIGDRKMSFTITVKDGIIF